MSWEGDHVEDSDGFCPYLSAGRLTSRILVFTNMPRNSSFWVGDITDFSVSSVVLLTLKTYGPLICRFGALWSFHCIEERSSGQVILQQRILAFWVAYIGCRHLFGEDFVLFSNGQEVSWGESSAVSPAFHHHQPPRNGCTESYLHVLAHWHHAIRFLQFWMLLIQLFPNFKCGWLSILIRWL